MAISTETAEHLLQNGHCHDNKATAEYHQKDARISTTRCCQCSVRIQHAVVGLVFGFVLYMYRVNMSIALPYMVKVPGDLTNETVEAFSNFTINRTTRGDVDDNCGDGVSKIEQDNEGAEFTWDKTTQSFVLSGYFYGYIVSQIPLTWATGRYGGKNVITTCMILSAGLMLLVPVFARASVYAVIVSRVLLGAASKILSEWQTDWILMRRRGTRRLIWIQTVCKGTIGIVFVLLWVLLIADSPETHSRISTEEKALFKRYRAPEKQSSKAVRVPWLAILTSVPVWAIFITHTFDNFTQYLILLSLPQFLKDVMRYDIQRNGGFSSLPSISNAIGLVIAGYLADAFIKRRWLSTTAIRKIFQITALVGAAVFIVIPGYMNCHHRAVAIVCLCACMLFNALGQGVGYPCSAVDIAPRHASVIYSISNTLASVPGMLGPLAVAELTPNGTAEEWRVVFYIAAGLALSAAVVYGLFSSSEIASWAEGGSHEVTIDVTSASDELLRDKPRERECDTAIQIKDASS